MRKYLSIILAVLLAVVAVSLSVSASDEKISIEISGDGVVSCGNTVNYTLTVKDIALPNGIIGADVHITYDTSVFEFVKVSSVQPDAWETDINDKTAGEVKFTAIESKADGKNPIKEDGQLEFKLSLKVKDGASGNSSISFTLVQCTGTDYEIYKGLGNPFTVKVKQSLASPSGLTWEGGKAKWTAVENAESYSIRIYKDGKEYGDPVSSSSAEYDFTDKLTEGGKYCFTVTAVSAKPEYGDSTESAKSGDYTVIGKLDAPKITITPDIKNGGFIYQITDTNAKGTVRQYIIHIFLKGSDTPVKTIETESKAGHISNCEEISAGKEYTATVTAITSDESVNKDSDTSGASSPTKAAAKVKNIAIKTQPKLVYIEGEKLDLSDMVVTINYDDGSSEDVKFADFEDVGLSVNWTDGKKLTLSDNNKTITVSFEDISNASTSAITVNSSQCDHSKTHTEQKLPSCGEDGFERVICDKCGAVISEKTIPATGKHQFGDWVIVVNPTDKLNGLKERVCSVCGEKETEIIPPLGQGIDTEPIETDKPADTNDTEDMSDTTESEVTVPPVTQPEDHHGGMKDLSRVFLIIVIVIFSLILIFIIATAWLENRRNKARRAKMNSRSRNTGNRRPRR